MNGATAERKVLSDLDRKRTLDAFGHAERFAKNKDMISMLKGLPVALRTQGLSIVCANLLKRDDYKPVVNALAQWLEKSKLPFREDYQVRLNNGQALLEWSVKTDNTRYRAAQREALNYVEQLKLLTEALGNGK